MTQPFTDCPGDTTAAEREEFAARVEAALRTIACPDPVMEMALLALLVAHFLAGQEPEHRAVIRRRFFEVIDEKTRDFVLAQCNG